MKRYLLLFSLLLGNIFNAPAQEDWKTWPVADSVRALSLYAELELHPESKGTKKGYAGIGADSVTLTIQKGKDHKMEVVMAAPGSSKKAASGIQIKQGKGKEFIVNRAGPDTGTYRLLLVKAFDSAQYFSLFSGYVFLPHLKKWKFIATVRRDGYGFIREVRTGTTPGKKDRGMSIRSKMLFRGNGTAHPLEGSTATVMPQYWRNPTDSSEQVTREMVLIDFTKLAGQMPLLQPHNGIYYSIETPGTGRQVSVSDTVTVYYSGHLLGEKAPFDATTPGKPARFPLGGLIRGWQIGLPLVKEGGKITLVIPSGLAYSTRTRSAKIPPSSILVFDIEVVKTEK